MVRRDRDNTIFPSTIRIDNNTYWPYNNRWVFKFGLFISFAKNCERQQIVMTAEQFQIAYNFAAIVSAIFAVVMAFLFVRK